MNRPVGPILHDYKPSAEKQGEKKSVVPWFVAGLGLPLIGIALLLSQANAPVESADLADLNQVVTDAIARGESNGENLLASTEVEPAGAPDQPLQLADSANPTSPLENASPLADFHPPLELPVEFDRIALTIKRGDTLDQLFRQNKLDPGDLAMIMRLPDAAPYLKKLIPGDELIIEHDERALVSLYREIDLTSALRITAGESGFAAEIVDRPIEIRRKLAYGRINNSLFESAMQAGLPDKTVMNLAGIFAWDVDFVLDIRRGDDYYVLVEELYQDGEYLGDGEIIAAEFNNNGRTIQAIRFIDSAGRSDYFTPDGHSVRKAFVRAPVDFTRISSSFNPKRRHPILNTIRAHRGVDYAAPRGTKVMAAGDGKVIFRGVKNGYGNTVILQHGGNITTLYAHLSSFDRKAGIGKRVVQGQTIAYVGRTGLATANHLHYEYRLNGVHRNPRTVNLPQAAPIRDEYRAAFLLSVEPILDELLQNKRTRIAALSVD